MEIVILGLSITSSWGNGHATTYRALVSELTRRGHRVTFFERDMPWYAKNRDLSHPPYGETVLYESLADIKERGWPEVTGADCVIVGSYVPEGTQVIEWVLEQASGVTAFYDIDTPVTLGKLQRGDFEYLKPDQISQFDLYLSFTGGHCLRVLEEQWGARRARPLYCSVDTALYYPEEQAKRWDLGYLGTYSLDRQPPLERLMLSLARQRPGKYVVAGPQYPEDINWPAGVERIEHLPPARHRRFYNQQRFTLNITREDMVRMGFAPSVRLFEAAACGVPIISDWWEGLDSFFTPGKEILVSASAGETRQYLEDIDEDSRRAIGEAARQRVLQSHTAAQRAAELEAHIRKTVNSGTARFAPDRTESGAVVQGL